MCGRFAVGMGPEELEQAAEDEGLEVEGFEDRESWEGRRYNVAPRTRVPVLRGGSGNGRVRFEPMQWGVIPHWQKHPETTGQLKTINARDDSVLSGSGMWASIRGRKRAVIIVDGFYEWLTKSPKNKIAHFTRRKGKNGPRPLVFACLWDSVTFEGQSEALHTFTIVTTDSNKQLSFLHDRMPVVLPDRESIIKWLDTSSGEWSPQLSALIKPFAESNGLDCYRVTPEVGKVGNNSPEFMIPVAEKKGGLESFFSKQASSPPKKSPAKPEAGPSSSGSKKRDPIVLDDDDGDEPPTADPDDRDKPASKKLKSELNSA